jgi:hypothetical protein
MTGLARRGLPLCAYFSEPDGRAMDPARVGQEEGLAAYNQIPSKDRSDL